MAWWLRKLPPQAFVAPLPALSTDPDFGFRIARLVPRDPRLAPIWLSRVAHAHEACGPDYALWLARQDDLIASSEEFFMFMAAWAWFSEHEGHLGHRLLRKPWQARNEFQAGARGAQRLAPAAAAHRVAGLRHRNALARPTAPLPDTISSRFERSMTSSRKARRWTIAWTSTPTTSAPAPRPCSPSARTRAALPASRSGCTRRKPPCRPWCSSGQPAIAGPRPMSGRRPTPGSAASSSSRSTPERHTPKPSKRVEARRQLWGPYLAFLAGTPHEQPFRRVVMAPS